jgi:hypothetical protein
MTQVSFMMIFKTMGNVVMGIVMLRGSMPSVRIKPIMLIVFMLWIVMASYLYNLTPQFLSKNKKN